MAEEGVCDGCGEQFDVDRLEVLSMPSGEQTVCCPDCAPHARRAADRQRARQRTVPCEGCEARVHPDDLAKIELPDGPSFWGCETCQREAAERLDGEGGSGGTHPDDTTASETDADQATETDADHATADPNTDHATAEATPAEPTTTTETAPARTKNVCTQCGDAFSVELFRVVTVDDRTEKLCHDCKAEIAEKGIVKDVKLRRAQAYRVLDVATGTSEERVREAYIRRVKQVHPDRDDGSRSEFMLVKRAYERLTDG